MSEKKKILLVEDDPIQSMMYETALQGAGYEVLAVETGREALKKMLANRPDLVILDLLLGDMKGEEVLKKAKADEQTKDIKIVIFSNLNDHQLKEECREIGAVDYLVKSQLIPSVVVEKVKKYIG